MHKTLVAAPVAVGFVLRAAQLPGLDINVDEGMYVVDASGPSLAEVWRRVLANPHPPANTFLVHLLLGISWDPTFLKLVSIASGTAMIWLGWLFGRALLGNTAGLTVATAIAFSPQLVALSATLRAYSPAFALLLLALLFFARFLERLETRELARFALFATLCAPWLYALLVPLLGVNLALAVALWRGKAGREKWIRAVAYQTPLAAWYLFSYFVHIRPHLGGGYAEHVRFVFHEQLSLAPRGDWLPTLQGWLSPITGTFRYLAGDMAEVAFAFAVLGGVGLALRRRFVPLVLLLSPLPVAYALVLAERLPCGEIRQSAYLFPFFFGLVGAFCQLALDASPGATWLRRARVAIVSLLGAGWVALSLGAYLRGPETVGGLLPGITKLTGFETPTRTEDLEAVVALLEQEGTERDLILVSYQSLVALWVHARLGPEAPSPERPARYTLGRNEVHYSPKGGNGLSAGRFVDALADVETRHPATGRERIIVPRTGWELYSPSLGETISNVYPGDHASFEWLRDHRNARGQPIATVLDIERARALERLPDEVEDERFYVYLQRRLAKAREAARRR